MVTEKYARINTDLKYTYLAPPQFYVDYVMIKVNSRLADTQL